MVFHLKSSNEDAPGIRGWYEYLANEKDDSLCPARVVLERDCISAFRRGWMVLERVVSWKACRCSLLRFPDVDARPSQSLRGHHVLDSVLDYVQTKDL